jgi:hypothetical protein
MIFKNYLSKLFGITLFSLICLNLLTNCSVPKFMKPGKVSKDTPVNARDRARANVESGRGISLKDAFKGGNRGTNYEFSTSNPLWRSSLEILDFLPLTTVDYSGGIIITDWYNDSSTNDSIKITVRFLSNEVKSDSLKIIIHKKKCKTNSNCKITVSNSKIKEELNRTILSKAANLETELKKKK